MYEKAPLGQVRTILVGPEHEDSARVYSPVGEVNVYWVPEINGKPAFLNISIHSNKSDPRQVFPLHGRMDPKTGTAFLSIGESDSGG